MREYDQMPEGLRQIVQDVSKLASTGWLVGKLPRLLPDDVLINF